MLTFSQPWSHKAPWTASFLGYKASTIRGTRGVHGPSRDRLPRTWPAPVSGSKGSLLLATSRCVISARSWAGSGMPRTTRSRNISRMEPIAPTSSHLCSPSVRTCSPKSRLWLRLRLPPPTLVAWLKTRVPRLRDGSALNSSYLISIRWLRSSHGLLST